MLYEVLCACRKIGIIVGVKVRISNSQVFKSITDIIQMIKNGDVFYIESPSTGKRSIIEINTHWSNGKEIIKTSNDAIWDNNLNSLSNCNNC